MLKSLLQKNNIVYQYYCAHWKNILKGSKNVVLPGKSLVVLSVINRMVRFRVRDGIGNIAI